MSENPENVFPARHWKAVRDPTPSEHIHHLSPAHEPLDEDWPPLLPVTEIVTQLDEDGRVEMLVNEPGGDEIDSTMMPSLLKR